MGKTHTWVAVVPAYSRVCRIAPDRYDRGVVWLWVTAEIGVQSRGEVVLRGISVSVRRLGAPRLAVEPAPRLILAPPVASSIATAQRLAARRHRRRVAVVPAH
jgi:hypothetical protein